jgi:hypothetical protein
MGSDGTFLPKPASRLDGSSVYSKTESFAEEKKSKNVLQETHTTARVSFTCRVVKKNWSWFIYGYPHTTPYS